MTAPISGLRDLRKIQIGKESTPGTDHAATARLVGKLDMSPDFKFYRPDDLETGRLSSYERSTIVGKQAKITFEADANYEQLAYILGMAIKGGINPTGAGPYVWTFLPNLTSANSPDTYTVEGGDDHQAYQSTYCFATGMELSGQIDDVVKVKADIVGQSVDTTTFTAALTEPSTLTPIEAQTCKLYIDTTWAGLGGTQAANTLVDFTWKLTEGVTPIKKLDGSLSFADRVEKKRHIELEATFGHNSIFDSAWTNFQNQSVLFVRLAFTGPAITGGNMGFNLDGCFILDNPDPLSDQDGQDVVKIKLLSEYDPTSTKEWQVVLTNSLAAMP
jgi:hypothetical protein